MQKTDYQSVSFEVSGNESKDSAIPKLLREPSDLPAQPSALPAKLSGLRKFCGNFLNWGNIFQSFIGTSILSLPYYCMRVC
jgi:hypothetical protein